MVYFLWFLKFFKDKLTFIFKIFSIFLLDFRLDLLILHLGFSKKLAIKLIFFLLVLINSIILNFFYKDFKFFL